MNGKGRGGKFDSFHRKKMVESWIEPKQQHAGLKKQSVHTVLFHKRKT